MSESPFKATGAIPSLAGRTALVTGGGRGLGRCMVLALAQAGATVVATAARHLREVTQVATEAPSGTVIPLQADVADPSACTALVTEVQERFGSLDILVNNAARGMKFIQENFMQQPTRFWEADPAAWKLLVDTNINGPFFMTRAAVPGMLKSGWGRIINVLVSYSTMQRRGFSPYGSSKAALESQTHIWAQELAGTGVTVNGLLPGGATLTGMIPDSFPEADRARLLQPQIIVPPLLFLASTASDGFTGKRLDASRWPTDLPAGEAAHHCARDAGVYPSA